MKVAFIQFASASIHVAASLEILRSESLVNDNYYCYWGNSTSYPGRMSTNYESFSKRFPTKLKKAVKLADQKTILDSQIEFDSEWVTTRVNAFMAQLKNLSSMRELDSLAHDSIYPGPALANELTTLLKNRNICFDTHQDLIRVLLTSYLEVFYSTINFIENREIEKVIVFNGRFLHERAVWDASKSIKTNVLLFETTRDRYHLREKGFHDRLNNQKEMINFWNQSEMSLEEKVSIGSRYFELLRSKSNPFARNGNLDLPLDKPFFVYFTNSDDEAVGFWESWDEKLGTQVEVVRNLQEFFDSQDEFELVIRLHPNLQNKSESQKLEWNSIKETRNSRIVSAESTVPSYDLMDQSLGVITFGSTIGLEAAFSRKPSLLLADSGYDELGVCDKPKDWEKVFLWIQEKHMLSQDELEYRRSMACIRGYYLELGGNRFLNSKLREIGWGSWEATKFRNMRIVNLRVFDTYHKIISRIKFYKITRLINE